jgi:hypothetical protein
MMFRAAIALIALAVPVFAQRGAAHAGFAGNRGSAGHVGFSGSRGFSQPRNFVSPAPPMSYGALGSRGFQRAVPPGYSSFRTPYGNRVPYNGNRFGSGRNTADAGASRNRKDRRRSFRDWYRSIYSAWPGYGYPYLIDPGFYDWGDSDTYDDEGGAAPAYAAPTPDEGYGAPNQQSSARALAVPAPAASSAPAPEQSPLTVIFKDGRTPAKMQNYMMTAKVLTDLDPQHYEQIPLDQVDKAATVRVNTAAGVEFQIPEAVSD